MEKVAVNNVKQQINIAFVISSILLIVFSYFYYKETNSKYFEIRGIIISQIFSWANLGSWSNLSQYLIDPAKTSKIYKFFILKFIALSLLCLALFLFQQSSMISFVIGFILSLFLSIIFILIMSVNKQKSGFFS